MSVAAKGAETSSSSTPKAQYAAAFGGVLAGIFGASFVASANEVSGKPREIVEQDGMGTTSSTIIFRSSGWLVGC